MTLPRDVRPPNSDYMGLTRSARLNAALVQLHGQLFDSNGQLRPQYCEYVDCPVCGSSHSNIYCIKDYFQHVRCSTCSLVYLNPRLNEQATVQFYNSEANEIYNEAKFPSRVNVNSLDDKTNKENAAFLGKIFNKLIKSDLPLKDVRILEIGCAKGYFLNCAAALGAQPFGIELNQRNAAIAKTNKKITIYQKEIFECELPDEFFDVCYARDVIEHIHNPIKFLLELARVTKQGGLIFLDTHNIDSLINSIVGGKHTCIFGFEHPVHWSPQTLKLALEKVNFSIIDIVYSSQDLSVSNIIEYFKSSTWTTIFSWQANPKRYLLLSLLSKILALPLLRQASNFMLARAAAKGGRGSTMKVVAQKN